MNLHIQPLDRAIEADLRRKINRKTKPPGSLGRLEELALQLGLIQGSDAPRIAAPHILVCAGDHGAAQAGVSAYPQDVTWQMVENFLAGGAAINALARQAGVGLVVADAGVAHDFGSREALIDAKVMRSGIHGDGAGGTASYLDGPAMSAEQCAQALASGARVAGELAARGCNAIGFGEMGIGNTASASLITHCLTGAALVDVVGRGTGLDDAGLARKYTLLAQALSIWPERPQFSRLPLAEGEIGRGSPHLRPKGEDGKAVLAILARYGGFEIAMLAGAMLKAAEKRMVLMIDGFIVTAALLVAERLAPAILDYCVFAHRSGEPGHAVQLDHLGARPLLDLGLRLGEGTGAALAFPLLGAACAFINEMASFESAGVSDTT
jgi:nicotinate-nucleotide--dimethylbenzimidazole phosphoribosyltransferase